MTEATAPIDWNKRAEVWSYRYVLRCPPTLADLFLYGVPGLVAQPFEGLERRMEWELNDPSEIEWPTSLEIDRMTLLAAMDNEWHAAAMDDMALARQWAERECQPVRGPW